MFYKIDSTKVTLKEYWWGKKDPVHIAFAGLLKLFRVDIPSSVDDPNVESMQPFQVAEESLPEPVRTVFAPLMQKMASLGFMSPVFHALVDGFHITQIYQATFLRADGTAIGRIHYRIWEKPHPTRRSLFPMFISLFNDKTFLISTAGKPDMLAPPSCQLNRIFKADATTLWHSHQQELGRLNKPFFSITTTEGLLWAIETFHAEVRDFHLKRGVFRPMSVAEESKGAAMREKISSTAAAGLLHAEVLAELDAAQQKPNRGWGRVLLILAVSLLVFVGTGASTWSWEYVLLLIPILLFHEAGHYLAMRIFHYRNLRMFFIPFFGAAVSGRNYNVPGWKKIVVSLMGPVPGIGVGVVLGIIGMLVHKSLLIKLAMLMLILNGFNLLPILPLDGGWVMHAVFFSRHHLLDTGFRLVAALAMVALSIVLKTKSLMYVGIATLVSLPVSYKLARVAHDVRAQGVSPASADDQNVPTATAQIIITEIKKAFPKNVTSKTIANQTLQVFETLNARPPNWPVSILFLGVHGFSVVVAVVFAVVFVMAQNRTFQNLARNAAFMPRTSYQCGAAKIWRGEQSDKLAEGCNTLAASFKTQSGAEKAFEDLRGHLPATAATETFGRTLLITLPRDDEAARKEWLTRLQRDTTNIFVDNTNFSATLSLLCVAKTEADAKAIEEEANEYFGVAALNTIPPWLAHDTRTPQEREQQRLARHTHQRLQSALYEKYKDPQFEALTLKMSQARRQGDNEEYARLSKEQTQLTKRLEAQNIEQLHAEGPDQVDVEMINLYTNLSACTRTNALYQELNKKMVQRLGQMPMENEKETAEFAKYAVHWGSVSRNGLIITFTTVSFHSVFDGAPALADWLCNKGCIGFRYDFRGSAFSENDDDN